jgi:multisubunit Na+/H+ antiporter MnhE subunit
MSAHDRPRGGGGARGARRAWLAWWVLLMALWLGLTDSRRLQEIVAGVVVAAIGATASVLVRSRREFVMRPRARWIVGALGPPLLNWPRDLALLAVALVRRPRGRIVEEPLAAARGRDPASGARRALAVVGGTLAPNSIVVGVDPERRVIVRHELAGAGE